jgi:anti-sigma regulatory factor (Ser/Thr protein kinase)
MDLDTEVGHLEVRLPIDVDAPAAARVALARFLGDVAGSSLAGAQLVASELVSNSVRHSGATAADQLVLRVELTAETVRVEVEDPGRDATIATRPADLEGGGGLGLNLVRTLCERWGVEHPSAGGTRVWGRLLLA